MSPKYEPNKELVATLGESERPKYYTGVEFKQRMDEEHPLHAKYYCDHGRYVGFLRDLSKCPYCQFEGKT